MSFDFLLIRDHPIRGDGQRDFLRELERSTPPLPQDSLPDAAEARNDFWSISGNFKNCERRCVDKGVRLLLIRESAQGV